MTKLKFPFYLQILAGMIAGAVFGLVFPQFTGWVTPIGAIFIKLLRLIVIPLIFVSIVDGVIRVGSAEKLSTIGLKTTAFYLTTNFLAVLTSLALSNLIRPGDGVQIFGAADPARAIKVFRVSDLIPDNIFAALANADTFQIIFVAIICGAGMLIIREKVPTLIRLASEANELLLSLTQGVIALAPIGVFGLLAGMVNAIDWGTLVGVGKFAAVILIGLMIHGCITLPIFFKAFSDRPLPDFLKKMQPALLTAFSTSSSSATLPVTMECIEKEAGIPKEIAGFVLPIGAVVNMDGTAIYEAAACLFVAQAIGVDLSLGQQIVVLFLSALAAIGAASIPSAGLITLTMVLTAVGLPVEGIGFLLAIDRPLDMSRTIVNVWGDMVGCVVVEGKTKKMKNIPKKN